MKNSKIKSKVKTKRSIKFEDVNYKCLSEKDKLDLQKWNNHSNPVKKTKIKNYDRLEGLSEKIKGSSYKDFLKSEYWSIIKSRVIKRDGYKCKWCNSVKFLEVHHKTYKHHFKEHLYMRDLITLCRDCHSNHHKNFKNNL